MSREYFISKVVPVIIGALPEDIDLETLNKVVRYSFQEYGVEGEPPVLA